jgi:hypothetical protein
LQHHANSVVILDHQNPRHRHESPLFHLMLARALNHPSSGMTAYEVTQVAKW